MEPKSVPQGPPQMTLFNSLGQGALPGELQFVIQNPYVQNTVQHISSSAVENSSSYLYRIRERMHTHFDVSHGYVVRKLILLLFPYYLLGSCCKAARSRGRESEGSTLGGLNYQMTSSPREILPEGERPTEKTDLYIPLMSFLSYIILYAWTKGTLNDFEPKILSERTTVTSVTILLETLICWSVKMWWIGDTEVPFLEVLATASYKFVSLSVVIAIGLALNSVYPSIYTAALVYLVATCVSSTLVLHLGFLGHQDDGGWGKHRGPSKGSLYAATVCAVLQIPLFYMFTPPWHRTTD
eukprot:Protomagalhaensia_sp_Gyna_25__2680@NODE_2531_length_1031_cov_196_789315_g2099_i0_p1_GENE_NODE_2531_length_1031_cov_196_789315_g2099_i0NODE_2531_length_1031_cov_196_789315_g2099_i0_p1_ORF_typecomplete_len338_score28_13YIF1/PF03878_15/4_2e38Yip1/PF04893_17/1_4e05_NODE_2531_length_1031_cov_196_789315_g2099_i01261016